MINYDDIKEQYKVYTIHDIEMIHIADFAKIANRSIQATRHLIEDGNKIRKMKAFRDRSRLMIPVLELFGFPFLQAGSSQHERLILHYRKDENGVYRKTVCTECSYGNMCEERKAIEGMEVPAGDD